jgi:uncharacterized membrane protein
MSWPTSFEAYRRLLAGAVVGAGVAAAAPADVRWALGYAAGATTYLALAVHLTLRSDQEDIRRRAQEIDVDKATLLSVAMLAGAAGLAAVVAQLGGLKEVSGWPKIAHVALAFWAVASGWAMTHVVFALHHAHEFYGAEPPGGLAFPNEEKPNYLDFIYFSFVIACAAQTADVSLQTRGFRASVLAQSVFAFFYNLAILGLTVNVAASLI